MHLIAFVLMLADGALIGTILFHHTAVMALVSSLLGVMYCFCIILALVKQQQSDTPGTVRRVTWASLVFVCVSSFVGYFAIVATLMPDLYYERRGMVNQWDLYQAMFHLSPQHSPSIMTFYLLTAACSVALGALGLIRVKKHRDDSTAPPRPVRNPGGGPRL